MVGLHVSRMHTEIVTAENDQEILTSSSTPLPAMGLHGTVALGRKTYLRAYLQLFRMHFDHFSGSMNHLNVVLQHAWRRNWSVGLGYSLYDLKLDSEHSSIDGSIEIRHHGPQIFLGVHF